MNHYDEIDVSLIPLVNNEFNLCKSPLKLVEAYLKGCLPIVYNIPLYTQYITNGVNGFVAKDERDFTKIVKRIINNPSLITEMTENFINSVKDEFDLEIVTKKRVQWYKELLEKKNNK
jgi:glycosyltransferase involved in cell wall biosynthesis